MHKKKTNDKLEKKLKFKDLINQKGSEIKCKSKSCLYNLDEVCVKGFIWIDKTNVCKCYKEKQLNKNDKNL